MQAYSIKWVIGCLSSVMVVSGSVGQRRVSSAGEEASYEIEEMLMKIEEKLEGR